MKPACLPKCKEPACGHVTVTSAVWPSQPAQPLTCCGPVGAARAQAVQLLLIFASAVPALGVCPRSSAIASWKVGTWVQFGLLSLVAFLLPPTCYWFCSFQLAVLLPFFPSFVYLFSHWITCM